MRHLVLLTSFLCACTDPDPQVDADAGAPRASEVAAPTPPLRAPPPEAPPHARVVPTRGQTLRIPAGNLLVGTRPGTRDRRPSVEADLIAVAMPAVDIDALPFPNDPSLPPQLAGTRAEAVLSCEASGRRLCTELEWERACRGDTEDRFATGAALDVATCAEDPAGCAASTGALEMGITHAEWTSSDAEERLARLERTAVVRGANPDDPTGQHGCGTRQAHDPAGGGRALAFRCCGGPPPNVSYPDVGLRRLYTDLEWDDARYREVLASIPELAGYAEGFEVYGESAALRALGRGHAGTDDLHWELVRAAFAWSPSPGEELYVFAGASGERSLVAAIYPMPDGRFVHAASFLFEDEAAPVALMRDHTTRGELIWSTCWGCMGESGVIRFQEDATIVIAQQ